MARESLVALYDGGSFALANARIMRLRGHRLSQIIVDVVVVVVIVVNRNYSRGESAALGQRMPWANRLFSKSIKGTVLNFLHEFDKMISVISVEV